MLTNVSIISTNKVQDLLMKQITSQGHVVGSTFSEYGTAIREYKTNLPQVVIVDSDIIGSEITFKRFLYEIFYLIMPRTCYIIRIYGVKLQTRISFSGN